MARVLVIDDDPGYRELLSLLLSGHEMQVCGSAEEAEPWFKKREFDLVICDINLGEKRLSGLEFLREKRAQGLTETIPFVMCSSMSDPATKSTAIEEGAAAFLVKPFAPDAFALLLKGLLG